MFITDVNRMGVVSEAGARAAHAARAAVPQEEDSGDAKKGKGEEGKAWQTFFDAMGRPYYFNAGTGVTQWEPPPGALPCEAPATQRRCLWAPAGPHP